MVPAEKYFDPACYKMARRGPPRRRRYADAAASLCRHGNAVIAGRGRSLNMLRSAASAAEPRSDRRLLIPLKNNLGSKQSSLAFRARALLTRSGPSRHMAPRSRLAHSGYRNAQRLNVRGFRKVAFFFREKGTP